MLRPPSLKWPVASQELQLIRVAPADLVGQWLRAPSLSTVPAFLSSVEWGQAGTHAEGQPRRGNHRTWCPLTVRPPSCVRGSLPCAPHSWPTSSEKQGSRAGLLYLQPWRANPPSGSRAPSCPPGINTPLPAGVAKQGLLGAGAGAGTALHGQEGGWYPEILSDRHR